MAAWSRVLADGLRRRRVREPAASLAAETGVAVFRVSFERWVSAPEDRELAQVMRESLDQLRSLAGD